MEAAYTDDSVLPGDSDRRIASFTIGPPAAAKAAPGAAEAKLKVHFRLNLHGIVTVESVNQLEEEEYEEEVKVEKPKPAAAPAPAAADAKMEDAAPADAPVDAQQEAEDAAAAGVQVGETGPSPMETEARTGNAAAANGDAAPPVVEKVKRKRVRKHAVPVESETPGLKTKQLQGLYEKECQMALQDRIQEETNEVKNALEAYVYQLRGKLADAYADYSTEQERSTASQQLEKMEDWLYDEGEDEIKSVYTAKLNELKALGAPVEGRYREAEQRPAAIASLSGTAQSFITFAQTTDPAYSHISAEERQSVMAECQKALVWLQEKETAQRSLRKTDEPVLVCADIKKKEDTLTRFANPIVTKPPPPPPKKEEKKEEEKPAATATATSEPMETEDGAAQAAAADGPAQLDPMQS